MNDDLIASMRPLTAQQLDVLIERHCGGTELTDGEYSSMVMFAASVEREHGIGVDALEAAGKQQEPVQCNPADYCAARHMKLYAAPPADTTQSPLYTITKNADGTHTTTVTQEGQPAQEPVAWRYKIGTKYELSGQRLDHYFKCAYSDKWIKGEPLYTAPPADTARAQGIVRHHKTSRFHKALAADLAASQPAQEPVSSLRLFLGAAYPVSTDIDPRGYKWSEAYLDQARAAALAAPPATQQAEPAPGYCPQCKQYTIAEPLPADDEAVRLLREARLLCNDIEGDLFSDKLAAAIDAYLAKAKR